MLSNSRIRGGLSVRRLARAFSSIRLSSAPVISPASRALRRHKRAAGYLAPAAVIAAGGGVWGLAAVSGPAPAHHAPAHHAPAHHAPAHHAPAAQASTVAGLGAQARQVLSTPAQTAGSAHTSSASAHLAPGHPAPARTAPAQPVRTATPASPAPAAQPAKPSLSTWSGIEDAAANQGAGSPPPLMDIPLPIGVTAPQSQMPMNDAQWQNATTIVQQSLQKGMGLRSAVIAVATAMQESKLVNVDYGTYDSLGLFQQRPSAGWGTPAEVTDPVYAADAFLDALHVYQLDNPDWATQPVWQPAQGVQDSAYPYAYGQWEVQAAQIVMGVARNLL